MGQVSQYEIDLGRALVKVIESLLTSDGYLTSLPILADTPRNRELLEPAKFREKFRRDRRFQIHEFLGDKVAALVIGIVVYKLFGDDYTPGFYHAMVEAMGTNQTFLLLMKSTGAYDIICTERSAYLAAKGVDKVAADVIEVFMYTDFVENGLASVTAWVEKAFLPIAHVARAEYDRFVTKNGTSHQEYERNLRFGPLPTAAIPTASSLAMFGRSAPSWRPLAGRTAPRALRPPLPLVRLAPKESSCLGSPACTTMQAEYPPLLPRLMIINDPAAPAFKFVSPTAFKSTSPTTAFKSASPATASSTVASCTIVSRVNISLELITI
ncbi:hypothetical protein HWV62_42390 [Athelia sp. TMB]|nr:hypothetical protein HWV62_42390 [Athelia sp. TMB]